MLIQCTLTTLDWIESAIPSEQVRKGWGLLIAGSRCSLQSGQPFDGAQGNLLRLLDKNSRLLLEAPHGG